MSYSLCWYVKFSSRTKYYDVSQPYKSSSRNILLLPYQNDYCISMSKTLPLQKGIIVAKRRCSHICAVNNTCVKLNPVNPLKVS